jgi:hypothetical protein
MTSLKWSVECKSAVKDVRSDKSETTWAAVTYAENSMEDMVLLATGSGDADELKSKLVDDKVVFALLRTHERIDESITTKFVFVNWAGTKTRRMLLARQSVHAGAVLDFFSPYHVDLKCDSLAELSAKIVAELVATASGQKSHVLAADSNTSAVAAAAAAAAPVVDKPKPVTTPVAAAAASTSPVRKPAATAAAPAAAAAEGGARSKIGIAIDDEAALTAAIASVRRNDSGVNWALVSYVPGAKPDCLTLVGTGSGGVDELLAKLDDQNVYYGLTRHVEVIDKSETVKFAHIALNGAQAPRMLRARIGTHKGAVEAIFRPFHVDLVTDDRRDITERALVDLIGAASGTKSHVK